MRKTDIEDFMQMNLFDMNGMIPKTGISDAPIAASKGTALDTEVKNQDNSQDIDDSMIKSIECYFFESVVLRYDNLNYHKTTFFTNIPFICDFDDVFRDMELYLRDVLLPEAGFVLSDYSTLIDTLKWTDEPAVYEFRPKRRASRQGYIMEVFSTAAFPVTPLNSYYCEFFAKKQNKRISHI